MSDVERVSVAIDDWLKQEVIESRDGRNKPLDDFVTRREGFADRASMEAIADTGKNGGHYGRYNALLSLVDETMLQKDYLAAKLIHHSLMFVSGDFRLEATLKAANQAEYEQLRFSGLDKPNGATSGLIQECVAAMLDDDGLDIQTYLEMNHGLNQAIRDNSVSIYTWFMDNPDRLRDALTDDEEPVEAMRYTQNFGLLLAASHIAVAASFRDGDLARVPFLEPKSITDASPNPIYPIAT